jgi:hypothetical protein
LKNGTRGSSRSYRDARLAVQVIEDEEIGIHRDSVRLGHEPEVEEGADKGARFVSDTEERERESAAAVLGRPTRAREKRLGPVGPAAKTESRPTRVGFHAAGYTGKFFSFVFFSFLIFQTHFQIKFS